MTHYEQCCARECQYCNALWRIDYGPRCHIHPDGNQWSSEYRCTAPTLGEFAERCAEALEGMMEDCDTDPGRESMRAARRALGLEKG